VHRPRLTEFAAGLRWRAFGYEGRLVAVTIVVALAVLIAVWPEWSLEYLRVLAWPAVILIVLLLFRGQLAELLAGATLDEGRVGPAWFRFRQRQEQQDVQEVLNLVQSESEGLQAQLAQRNYFLELLVELLQIYDVQLGFLRHLEMTEAPVMPSDAEQWFRDALRPSLDAGANWNVPALIGWLANQGTLEIASSGAYELTPKARDLLILASQLWYAPKLA
jgi:hypothetical protein